MTWQGAGQMISQDAHDKLKQVSVATLTTCLFKRGLCNQFLQNVHPISQTMPRMVGEAFTLRMIPAREDIDVLDAYADPEHPQRKAIETIGNGQVLVIDSRNDARGASAGDILLARIKQRGATGAISDGGFRDTRSITELNFPVYQQRPSPPTGPMYHHACDFQLPIACGGVGIYPGDIMVGDDEGVVCLPAHLAEELAHEGFGMNRYEDWVSLQVETGRRLPGMYPATEASRAEFEKWQSEQS